MTLQELETKTRYYLNDVSAIRLKQPEVWYYINRAYAYYWNELVNSGYDGLLATPAYLDIVAATDLVALPTDFYKCKKLSRIIDTRIIPLMYKVNYEDTMTTTGVSSLSMYRPNYSFQGTNLKLAPMPAISATAGLLLDYWPTLTEMTAIGHSPVAGFSPQWQHLIPIRAAFIGKSNREEEDVSNIQNDLDREEVPFKQTIQSMTYARKYVEPFFTGGDYEY